MMTVLVYDANTDTFHAQATRERAERFEIARLVDAMRVNGEAITEVLQQHKDARVIDESIRAGLCEDEDNEWSVLSH